MPNWEEALGQTKDMLKRLCLLAGLGTPCGGPGRAGGNWLGRGRSRFLSQGHCPQPTPGEITLFL